MSLAALERVPWFIWILKRVFIHYIYIYDSNLKYKTKLSLFLAVWGGWSVASKPIENFYNVRKLFLVYHVVFLYHDVLFWGFEDTFAFYRFELARQAISGKIPLFEVSQDAVALWQTVLDAYIAKLFKVLVHVVFEVETCAVCAVASLCFDYE